jgi:hypothetical protein
MKLDRTMANLLSDLFLDIAKAYFIATILTPPISHVTSFWEIVLILTRGSFIGILYLLLAWQFAKQKDKL